MRSIHKWKKSFQQIFNEYKRIDVPADGNCALHIIMMVLKTKQYPTTCDELRSILQTLVKEAQSSNFMCTCNDVRSTCVCKTFDSLNNINVIRSNQYFIDTNEFQLLCSFFNISALFINSEYGNQSLLVGENHINIDKPIILIYCNQDTLHYQLIVSKNHEELVLAFVNLPYQIRSSVIAMNEIFTDPRPICLLPHCARQCDGDRGMYCNGHMTDRQNHTCRKITQENIKDITNENQTSILKINKKKEFKTMFMMIDDSGDNIVCTTTYPHRTKKNRHHAIYRVKLYENNNEYGIECIKNPHYSIHLPIINAYFNRTPAIDTDDDEDDHIETNDEIQTMQDDRNENEEEKEKEKEKEKETYIFDGDIVCVAFEGRKGKTEYGPAIIMSTSHRSFVCRWMRNNKDFKQSLSLFEDDAYKMPLKSFEKHMTRPVSLADFSMMSDYTLSLMMFDQNK